MSVPIFLAASDDEEDDGFFDFDFDVFDDATTQIKSGGDVVTEWPASLNFTNGLTATEAGDGTVNIAAENTGKTVANITRNAVPNQGYIPLNELGSVSTTQTGNPRDFTVAPHGRYGMLTCRGTNVLACIGISDPSAPSQLGFLDDDTNLASSRHNVQQGHYTYVVTPHSKDGWISAYDTKDPTAPTYLSRNSATDLDHSFDVEIPAGSPNYAIVANKDIFDYNGGIVSVDISDPSNLTVVDTAQGDVPDPNFIDLRSDGVAFATSEDKDFIQAYDISDPTAMTTLDSAATGAGPRSMDRKDGYAILACKEDNTLEVYSVTDAQNITQSFVVSDSDLTDVRTVTRHGEYLYTGTRGGTIACWDAREIGDGSLPKVESVTSSSPPNSSNTLPNLTAHQGVLYAPGYTTDTLTTFGL